MRSHVTNRAGMLKWLAWSSVLLIPCIGCEGLFPTVEQTSSWTRHTIDDSLHGADGVKLGDVDGDGLTDLVVGWEESGAVVVYLNPGPLLAKSPWQAVTVGEVGAVEDAVFVDLDDDGHLDVVSSCQGDVQTMFVHWGPADPSSVLDSGAWNTYEFPATAGQRQWMFCEPAQIDERYGVDLVAGAKGDNGQIGVLLAPSNPRNVSAWIWHPLASAAWIMSIIPTDMDADGDIDILYTDRKGDDRGCYWLENPGPGAVLAAWRRYEVGTSSAELMFMDMGDLGDDGESDIVVATDRRELIHFTSLGDPRVPWLATPETWSTLFGTGKGVRIADIDLDGSYDLV